jgi:hypothetical protein
VGGFLVMILEVYSRFIVLRIVTLVKLQMKPGNFFIGSLYTNNMVGAGKQNI